MDVKLKIYKAAERTVLANKRSFDISTAQSVQIPFSNALLPNATYEVAADFYTDADFYLELRNGNTVIATLDDTGKTHHISSKTFLNTASGVTSLSLHLIANRSGICNARVASLIVSSYVSYPDTDPRYVAEKWEFHDTVMGERYLMFTAKSPIPIDWKINDYAIYRGQRYYLNNVPACVQRGRSGDIGDSFTYENVKLDDEQGKLGDCMLLDVTPTTGDYVASEGTNYTGSSVFTLYCAETVVEMVDYDGNAHSVHMSPVEYIAGVIQANLNRLYPREGWRVQVNPELPHLDDKVISFNKQYVTDALSTIHNEWDLDYIVVGRTIRIGYTLNNVTDDGEGNELTFGYGRGYNEIGDDGKALFKIKRNINSSQKIVTRLRAMGSTKNMPYRYYNKKYELPQTIFVQNLQLPDTFETPATKATRNAQRDATYGIGEDGYPNLRHVLGDSNDAYIDKQDNAENCNDGVREGSAFWDGSDSDLEEIYPTIKEGTYLELRGAAIPDKDGTTGNAAYPNYGGTERIDEILAIDEQTTNIGDGILAESDITSQQELAFDVARSNKTEIVTNPSQSGSVYTWKGEIVELFTVDVEQSPGTYLMAASTYHIVFCIKSSVTRSTPPLLGYEINLWEIPSDGTAHRHLGTYQRSITAANSGFTYIILPDLPDLRADMKVGEPPTTQIEKIELSKKSTVRVIIQPMMKASNVVSGEAITWSIVSESEDVVPTYVWKPTAASDLFVNQPFYIYLKDMGIDMKHLQTTGEDATIHFNTGQCGGMEFKFNPNNVEDAVIGNKKGWKVQINERFIDKAINVYYPNANSAILPGDQYVLLGIEFPEIYIKLAELRLLVAATQYLADNCETKYTYEPEVSEIYLQQNIDRCEAAGDITKSIYWNLYAGYKFSMRGIPAADGDPLPFLNNITIQAITINEGEKPIPKVEIVLNDNVEQSTIKRLTTSVDRIYNSIFSGVGSGSGISNSALLRILRSEGSRLFLSKVNSDSANGVIDFLSGFRSESAASFGNFQQDVSGASIYKEGDAWHVEADYIHARRKLIAKELQIEEITHVGGRMLLSAAEMVCSHVVEYPTYYRCFFLHKDDDGKKIYNKFKIGDQAIMQSFNEGDSPAEDISRFYWRLVVGVGTTYVYDFNDNFNNDYTIESSPSASSEYNYIDLSKSDCAPSSDVPKAEDKIVQLGYRYDNDASRQNAIMLAGAGTGSPYIDEYVGVNSYTLEGRCKTRIKPNENFFTGKFELGLDSTFDGKTLTELFSHNEDIDEIMRQLELITFDLNNAKSELQNIGNEISEFTTGNANLLRNTGFTGDYETESISEEIGVRDDTDVYSYPLKYWESTNASVTADINSASGFSVFLADGSISQQATKALEWGEWYNVSFRAVGSYLTIKIGGYEQTIELTAQPHRYVFVFQCSNANQQTFSIQYAAARVMEIQLCAGKIPNADWVPSTLDNPKVIAYYQDLVYLANAMNASTTILGGLILTNQIRVGNYNTNTKTMVQETGGISGTWVNGNSPFLWGGGDMEKAFYTIGKYADNPAYQPTAEELSQMAKFVVTHGGRAILNDIVLRGYIYALGGVFSGTIHATAGEFVGAQNMFEFNVSANERAIVIEGPNVVSSSDPTIPAQGAQQVEYMRIGGWAMRPKSGGGYRITPVITGRTLANDGETTATQFLLDAGNGLTFVSGSGNSAEELARYTGFEMGGNSVATVILGSLPTSDAGLVTGQVWNDNGTLKIKQ